MVFLFHAFPEGSTVGLAYSDVVFRFPQYVPYPPPFSPVQFFLNWGLVGLLPEFFVGNLLRPSDVEDVPETVVVNEYFEFV